MPRTLTRATVAAAGALLALPLVAAPAGAWTDRVETANHGYDRRAVEESVQVTAPIVAGERSTIRIPAVPPFVPKRLLLIPSDGGARREIFFALAPRTTASYIAKLGDAPRGAYFAEITGYTASGEGSVTYHAVLVIARADPGTVRPSLAGSVTRRQPGGAGIISARAGDTVRYVAPPGFSFARATVKIGAQPDGDELSVPVTAPGGTTLSRAADGRSFTITVPRESVPGTPVARRGTPLNVVIGVPDAPTAHGVGRVYLYGRILADPAGTSWYAAPGPDGVTDTLADQHALRVGVGLTSTNGGYRVLMQADRNLVVYRLSDGKALWSSGRHAGLVTELEQDGTLVQKAGGGRVVWSNGRAGSEGSARLVMQNDGNLVVYRFDGRPLWSTGVRR